MPVGNVNSQERGAGARYNDGKAELDLIPVWIISRTLTDSRYPLPPRDQQKSRVAELVSYLGDWQQGHTSAIEIVALLSLEDLEDAARVLAYGKKKYAAWNWIKGMPWSVPLGCALRHAFAILRGEELDPESGLPHSGHLVCNLIMLAQFEKTYPEGDDRPIQWLSTDAREAPTGGYVSPEDAVLVRKSLTEIEQPQCYDPPGRGREPEAWRPQPWEKYPEIEPPGYTQPLDPTPRNQEDPWGRKEKTLSSAEVNLLYLEWKRRLSETPSTPTSGAPERSLANDGPSQSSSSFDPTD